MARSSTPVTPGAPPTKGTRKGNGAGWGGPARGAGNQAAGPGRPEGVRDGEGKAAIRAATFRELLAPDIPTFAQKWAEIAKQDGHPHQHTMILKAAEIAGEFVAKTEVAGAGGGPVLIERVIVDPKTANPDA